MYDRACKSEVRSRDLGHLPISVTMWVWMAPLKDKLSLKNRILSPTTRYFFRRECSIRK